jgi:hypothetical protein
MALIVTSAPTDQLSFEVKKPSHETMPFGLLKWHILTFHAI